MSIPKDEVKKQIEQTAILFLGKDDIQKRKSKLIIHISEARPSISFAEAKKIDDDLSLEDLDPEDEPRKPPTPHPSKPK